MSVFEEIYRDKRVWISGHTGFKGSWLAAWLCSLGAEVRGFSLPPPTEPALFKQLNLADTLEKHETGDVADEIAVVTSLRDFAPDFVFHLAAQPLVRASYNSPSLTYRTNVMGTISVLEGLRRLEKQCVAVLITTDKVYDNQEWLFGYREIDPLGGHDPYSSSKAAAEIAISSYRKSFFSPDQFLADPRRGWTAIASVRAGNVIGGGDWASDRIIPDCIRALLNNQPILLRNPHSTRPWQHVLEPLGGYLLLAGKMRAAMQTRSPDLRSYCSAFNFGPGPDANRTVQDLVDEILKEWPGQSSWQSVAKPLHEAARLNLSIEKADRLLGWRPQWNFEQTVARTTAWYKKAQNSPGREEALVRDDITAYSSSISYNI